MELKILKEIENPLFNRKEIEGETEAEVTPSHVEVKTLIAKKFSTKEENIRVKKIEGKFGSKTFSISANIYDSEENMKKTEHFSKKDLARDVKPEEKPVEEAPAQVEEKPEEKKNEEVKEETKVEEAKE